MQAQLKATQVNTTRNDAEMRNRNYDDVSLTVYDASWSPEAPAATATIHDAIMEPSFQASMLSLYEEYDELIPDEYDSKTDLGKIDKWIPLRKRLELFHKHFPCGELIITAQKVGISSTEQYVSVATMYVLTDAGYEPWFSAFGMGDPATAGADGAIAEADRIAKKRVLISFGLSDDPSQEVESLNETAMRKFVDKEVALIGEKGVEPLVTAYNSGYAKANNVAKIEAAQWKTSRGPMLVEQLSNEVIKKLAVFLSEKKYEEEK